MNRVQLPSRSYMGIQMALDRFRRAINAAEGALTFLTNGILIGSRSRVDFREGFEVQDNNPTATVYFPAQVTSAERNALAARAGTMVYDTDVATLFKFNGVNWIQA